MKKIRRAAAMMLSLLLLLTAFSISFPVSAATAANIEQIRYPLDGAGGGNNTWGHPALNFNNGWDVASRNYCWVKGNRDDGRAVYCVQPSNALDNSVQLPAILPDDFLDQYYNGTLVPQQIEMLLGRIFQYGYTGGNYQNLTNDQLANYIATQVHVWEVIVGERSVSYAKIIPAAGKNAVREMIRSGHPLYTQINAHYTRIETGVQSHVALPSFLMRDPDVAVTHPLAWNGSAYTVTLTDTNAVMANFTFSTTTLGVTLTKNGNQLIVSAATVPATPITVRAQKTGAKRSALVIWASGYILNKGQQQGVMQSGVEITDPVEGYVKVTASTGNLAIIKTTTNNNGNVAGFDFEVKNSSGTLIGTYTTTATGKIDIPNLQPGVYSVREINLSSDFVEPTPNPKSVTVVAGQTASVSFDNIRKRGVITVRKTDANPTMGGYSLAGAVFEVRDAGGALVDTITTGSNGRAQTKILPLGVYRVKEITAPAGFVLDPNTHTATLSGVQGNADIVYAPDVTIAEQPQVGRINLEKYNANTGLGDYSLAGAVFEIRSGTTLVDTVTTGADGKAQSKDLKHGTYLITEKTAPTGYVRNPDTFTATLVYGGQTVSTVYTTVRIPETPQTGRIRIYKSNANPAMGDYSLAGAVFEVLNTVNGALMDTVTVDAAGYGISKALPLTAAGKFEYAVKETKAPAGFTINTTTFYPVLSYGGQDVDVVYADVSVPETPQTGRINIIKTNSNPAMGDYPLAGAVFEVFDSGGNLVDTVTVGADGKGQSKDLKLGNYTVSEKSAPYGYIRNPNTYPVELSYGGENATVVIESVTVPEIPQTGRIRVHKMNANPNMGDYPLSNAVFEVFAAADILQTDGTTIFRKGALADTVTTDSSGSAITKELPLGAYTVREKTAPFGYVLNLNEYNAVLSYAGQEVAVTYTDVTIPEQPQVGTITVTKYDVATGTRAQGDATLTGAVFEVFCAADIKKLDGSAIYNEDQLVDTIHCGNTAAATTKELPLGAYYVQEKTPPRGYTLDTSRHDAVIAYQGQNVSVARINAEVRNKIVEGQIALVKHSDEPDPNVQPPNTQVEEPLENVRFEVFLKAAGSYGLALPTERDLLVTNADGYAISKKLPYGVYTVRELPDDRDYKNVEPFDVFVSQEGQIYRYILRNPWFRSLVRIIKVDSETGKTIPAAGISFRVKDLSTGQWVSQSLNYPVPTTIDVFETAPDGTLVMPESLKAGEYELHEVSAPYGYLLNKTPVRFTIHSTQSNPLIAEVVMANPPAKGIIKVEKQGPMLTGVAITDTAFGQQHTPIFSLAGLNGAVFDVVAAEDIVTPDGTLRYAKGAVVDTITTDTSGWAASKQLYLGNYTVIEANAPEGFVLDEIPHPVSLVYEKQEVPVVSTQIAINNIRQRVEIELQKLMERPVSTPDGFNAYQDVVFGLYADEDISAVDGTVVIPKGSLVSLMRIDDAGKGVINGELPFMQYFIKEVQTNHFYQLNDTAYPVAVEYAGQDVVTAKIQVNNGGIGIPNETKLGRIEIIKTGETLVGANKITVDGTDIYTPIYEERGLVGVTFHVYAEDDFHDVFGRLVHKKGDLIDTLITDETGRAASGELRLGWYRLVEEVPCGFVADDNEYVVTLGFDGEVNDIITKIVPIQNRRQKATLTLEKVCEIPENAPDSFNPYADIRFGVFAKSDIRAVAGVTVIPAGALLEIFGVGADGKGIITADLPAGNAYFIREMSTAAGYELDDTVYELVFDYAPEKGAVVVITVNSGKPIENRLMRGSLRIAKDFEGRETPINGVPFVITGTTIVGTEVTIHTKTDINGEILLENLLVGSYIIRESESDLTAGYVLSPEQSIIIAADETGRLAVYNWLVRGDIAVFKIDKNTGEVLAGAVFGLFQDGILIVEQTTDTDGIAKFMDIIYGTYEIRELFAPAGYLPVDEAFKVEIREKGKTITLEIANEKIPEPPASPQTGDDNDTLWPLILMGISVAVMIGLGIIAAKCKNRREDK